MASSSRLRDASLVTPKVVRRLLATAAVMAAGISGVGASTASASVTSVEGTPFSGVVTTLGAQCPNGTITSATVTWGDGASSAATVVLSGNLYNVSGNHTYARYGTYAGTVSVGVNCNGATFTQQGQFLGTISDAPLTAAGVAVSAVPGQAFTSTVAHLTDANPDGVASDDTASINWGDGTTSAATIAPAAGGGFDVTGSHTYATVGQDLISVEVTSSGRSRLSLTRGALIGIVPDPTVTFRSAARPLRTTSRRPSSSTSSPQRSTYSSASARSAAAIIRRAPSRAS
jgi:hypothetical protein